MILAMWWGSTGLVALLGVLMLCPRVLSKLFYPKYYCKDCAEQIGNASKFLVEMQLQGDKQFTIREV